MSVFTASNRMTIAELQDPKRWALTSPRGEKQFDPYETQALREFFRAEEDMRLGRWRWPDNPDFVVYAESGGLHSVVQESTGLSSSRNGIYDGGDIFNDAAVAYRTAHYKPWRDAKPGEVWVIDRDGVETVFRVALQRELLPITAEGADWYTDLDSPSLSNGRRIWPEDAS